MDYERLASQILIKLRGKLSQAHFSQKLGYKHNQIFKWENSERRIPWTAFSDICKVRKIDLSSFMFTNFHFSGEVCVAKDFLNSILGKSEPTALSKTLGISRYRLSGWLNGDRTPYLDDILKIFDCIEHRMGHFVVGLIGEKSAAEMEIDLTYLKFENFEARHPIFSAFLRLMETKAYLHAKKIEEGYFASRLNITLSAEKSLLKEAVELELLQTKQGKYSAPIANTDLRNSKAIIQQRLYWYKEGIKRLESQKFTIPENIFGNLVYSATEEEQKLILKRYLSFFNDVRAIINSKETPDNVYVLNVQLFPTVLK